MKNKLERLINNVLADTVEIHVPSRVWEVMPITHDSFATHHEYRVRGLIIQYICNEFYKLVRKPLVTDDYLTKLLSLIGGSKKPTSFVIRQGYSWYNIVISFDECKDVK